MKINDVFTTWNTTGGGIFTALMSGGRTFPWSTDTTITADILDYQYHGLISGSKSISPVVLRSLNTSRALPAAAKEILCKIIYNTFKKNWTYLYSALFADYNPINNYSMTEQETGGYTDTRTPTNWKVTETETNRITANDVYGFNSTSPVGSDKSTQNGTTETAYSGTDETEREIDRELMREGNIGVTTSQQMIESEIELRKKTFFEVVFRDVDRILALPIYEIEGSEY